VSYIITVHDGDVHDAGHDLQINASIEQVHQSERARLLDKQHKQRRRSLHRQSQLKRLCGFGRVQTLSRYVPSVCLKCMQMVAVLDAIRCTLSTASCTFP
jgi:hypothetical protein